MSLNDVSYSFSDDIDALLVGPGGHTLIPIAAVGPNTGTSEAANHSTVTLSDGGTLPTDLTPWGSSTTFKPANFGSYGLGESKNGFNEVFNDPHIGARLAVGRPGAGRDRGDVRLAVRRNQPERDLEPVRDHDRRGDGTGSIAGGWTLNITTASAAGRRPRLYRVRIRRSPPARTVR